MENFSNFYNSIKDYISESSALDKGRKDSLFPTGKEQKFNKKYSSFFSIPGAGNEKLGIKTSMFIDPHLYDNKNFKFRSLVMVDKFIEQNKIEVMREEAGIGVKNIVEMVLGIVGS